MPTITFTGGTAIGVIGGSFPPIHVGGVQNVIIAGQLQSTPASPIYLSSLSLQQICGLVPLNDCDYTDCRLTPKDLCWLNPVFADEPAASGSSNVSNPASTYTNDFNSFFTDWFPSLTFPTATITWTIQKAINTLWTDVIAIGNNAFGLYYPIGSIQNHPQRTGVTIDWGAVYNSQGTGYYRVCINVVANTSTGGQSGGNGGRTFVGTIAANTASITSQLGGTLSGNVAMSINGTTLTGTITGTINGFAIVAGVVNALQISGTFANGSIAYTVTGTINGIAFNGGGQYNSFNSKIDSGSIAIQNSVTAASTIVACKCSDIFWLRKWNCDQANGTVKFECWNDGVIGDIDNDYLVFDLCGMNLYDSCRYYGFIGDEKTSYDRVDLEFQSGLIDPIRNKALQKFKYNSKMMPKPYHDRFKVYCLMANTILGSDYTTYNADYFIKRKTFIAAGGYEPNYYHNKFHDRSMQYRARMADVSLDLAEGVQSVIKSICCTTAKVGGGT
jgi:hypothetical protein